VNKERTAEGETKVSQESKCCYGVRTLQSDFCARTD